MSETLPLIAAVLSLLLTASYGILKYHRAVRAELRFARRIKTLTELKTTREYSVEKVLRGILESLIGAYESPKGALEFHSKLHGDYSIEINTGYRLQDQPAKGLIEGFLRSYMRYSCFDKGKVALSFIIDAEEFSCCVDVKCGQVISQNEYLYVQELIKEKISRLLLWRLHNAVTAVLSSVDTPSAICDRQGNFILENSAFKGAYPDSLKSDIATAFLGLVKPDRNSSSITFEKLQKPIIVRKIDNELYSLVSTAADHTGVRESIFAKTLDELSIGMVEIEPGQNEFSGEFRIVSINRAFREIFGLEGSNSQSDEIAEILSVAIRSRDSDHLGSYQRAAVLSYMRHDGIKVRVRATISEGETSILVFEPLENSQMLVLSYRHVLDSAGKMFASGNLRNFLIAVQEASHSDGVALVKKDVDGSRFEIVEKVGFMIDVPLSIFQETTYHDLVNSHGCLVVPTKLDGDAYGGILALKPNEEATDIILMAAKLLEAFESRERDKHKMREQHLKLAAEAAKAEMANNLKSQFLANMSHEIRIPLNSIIGFGEILNEEHASLTSDLFNDFSANIVSAGKHLLNLINDILDLTKVETGNMHLDPEDFSINEMIESARRTLTPLLNDRSVRLDVEIDSDLGIMNADPVKFKQILYNLLSNAIKYSPKGNSVRLVAAKSGDGIEIKVIDRGSGIKKDDLGKLFKPFSQLDSKHGGTGLGLSLTKRLVELHGGSIWIDSTYGSGTTVIVYLPFARQAPAQMTSESRVMEPEHVLPFVTEDDQLFNLFNTVLDGTGYKAEKVDLKCDGAVARESGCAGVLVIDSAADLAADRIMPYCENANRILLFVNHEGAESTPDFLKGCDSRMSFIDRRNFTKSSVLTQLNIASNS